MDFILSRLALGNVRDAQADPPVDAILNLSEFHYPTTRVYRNLYFPDGVYIHPLSLIGECTEFIRGQLRLGRRVLVHCAEGISRSCVIGAAYLYECGMSLDEALAFIRAKRPIVNPAPSLLRAVRDYYGIADDREG
jgi:histidinol-phosphate aminotransferase